MKGFEWRHEIGFQETNLVGNVYYVNHLSWQGRCRELFLKEYAPDVLKAIMKEGLALATVRCSCDYYEELAAFDVIILRMFLKEVSQNRISLRFDYCLEGASGERLIARGEQQIACMIRQGEQTVPTPIPDSLLRALETFRE